jgi:hypothetical protein
MARLLIPADLISDPQVGQELVPLNNMWDLLCYDNLHLALQLILNTYRGLVICLFIAAGLLTFCSLNFSM